MKPSQNLLDDLDLTEKEQEIVSQAFYDEDNESKTPAQRILDRSEYELVLENIHPKFKPDQWMVGRFGDGTWPVLYSAESSHTALAEKTFHMSRFYREESNSETVHVDLAVAFLRVKTNALFDLSKATGLKQDLLSSPDFESYMYCQSIAKRCIRKGAQAIRSLSARDKKGFCIPIFTEEIIQKDLGIRNWYKVEIKKNRLQIYTGADVFEW